MKSKLWNTQSRPAQAFHSLSRLSLRADKIIRVMAGSCAVSLVLFALLFLGSYFSLSHGVAKMKENVLTAFASEELSDKNYAFGDTTIGVHQYNDCLVMAMAIDQRGEAWQNAVSPLIGRVGGIDIANDPCPGLHLLALGARPEPKMVFYHRYLHAHTVLARYLLPHLGVGQIRLVYSTSITVLLFVGLSFSLLQLCRGSNMMEAAFFATVFLTFARWFGLEAFSQSLSHGPSDLIVVLFLVFACFASSRGCKLVTLIAAASIFGALTIMFEFLTGGLPLGLAVVLGVTPWALGPNANRSQILSAVFLSVTAFCVAVASCLMAKFLVSLLLLGPEVISDYFGQLGVRMGLSQAEVAVPSGNAVVLIQKIVGGLNSLAVRNRTMSGLMLLAATACGVWGYIKVRRSDVDGALRTRAALLLASNIPIVAWFPVFWQHTIQHAWFMDRILVWTIASGFALFLLGLFARRVSSSGAQG